MGDRNKRHAACVISCTGATCTCRAPVSSKHVRELAAAAYQVQGLCHSVRLTLADALPHFVLQLVRNGEYGLGIIGIRYVSQLTHLLQLCMLYGCRAVVLQCAATCLPRRTPDDPELARQCAEKLMQLILHYNGLTAQPFKAAS